MSKKFLLSRKALWECQDNHEGSKVTKKEKRSFYLIARGSCHESAAIIRILSVHNIDTSYTDHWYADLVTIGKMLTGMIKNFESK